IQLHKPKRSSLNLCRVIRFIKSNSGNMQQAMNYIGKNGIMKKESGSQPISTKSYILHSYIMECDQRGAASKNSVSFFSLEGKKGAQAWEYPSFLLVRLYRPVLPMVKTARGIIHKLLLQWDPGDMQMHGGLFWHWHENEYLYKVSDLCT
ncbi:hypothetical protein ACJX0J_026422, partial [Zea mays]